MIGGVEYEYRSSIENAVLKKKNLKTFPLPWPCKHLFHSTKNSQLFFQTTIIFQWCFHFFYYLLYNLNYQKVHKRFGLEAKLCLLQHLKWMLRVLTELKEQVADWCSELWPWRAKEKFDIPKWLQFLSLWLVFFLAAEKPYPLQQCW